MNKEIIVDEKGKLFYYCGYCCEEIDELWKYCPLCGHNVMSKEEEKELNSPSDPEDITKLKDKLKRSIKAR